MTEQVKPPLAEYNPAAAAAFLNSIEGLGEDDVAAMLLQQIVSAKAAERATGNVGFENDQQPTEDLAPLQTATGNLALAAATTPEVHDQVAAGDWVNQVPAGFDFSRPLFVREHPEAALPADWVVVPRRHLLEGMLERYGWPKGATAPLPNSYFARFGYTLADIREIELEPKTRHNADLEEEFVNTVGHRAVRAQRQAMQADQALAEACMDETRADLMYLLANELMHSAYRHAGGVTGVRVYGREDGSLLCVVSDPLPERAPKTNKVDLKTFYETVVRKELPPDQENVMIAGDPEREEHGRGGSLFNLAAAHGYWIEPGILNITLPEGQQPTGLPADEKHMWFMLTPNS